MGTRIILFRDPAWRATRPRSTYAGKWEELETANLFTKLRWETSMTLAADGYEPHAFNIPTELDVIPRPISKDCTLLDEVVAAIDAKPTSPAEPNVDDCEDTETAQPTKFLFNYEDVKCFIKYQRMAEAGFTDYWRISPMGTAVWMTIEGDDEASATTINAEEDAKAAEVICSVVRLNEIPGDAALYALHDFLDLGTTWVPKPEWIKKIPLVRGDTLILPPFSVFKFEYTKDTLSSCGIMLRKEDLRNSIVAWRWDCLGKTMMNFKQGDAILNFLKEFAKKDPVGCGFTDAESLKELEADYILIADSLLD
jgi:hypothetical protein